MSTVVDIMSKDIFEVDRLYMDIISSYSYLRDNYLKSKDIAKKIELITDGIEDDKRTVSILKRSDNRISEELKTARKEYSDVKGSMKSTAELVKKLEKMDSMQTELGNLRRRNASMRLKVTPLSAKLWGVQEDLFNLGKKKKQVQKEHSEVMKMRDEVAGLRSKVLPLSELLELKSRLASESAALNKNSEEAKGIKEELSGLIPLSDSLKEELKTTIEKFPFIQEHISSMKEKIKKLSSKVVPEEEVKRLEEEVNTLKERKGTLTEEKKEISPRIATITEEEEKLSAILESYQLKNKKERDRLSALKKELKGMDIDKGSVDALREKVSIMEGNLEAGRAELKSLKKEHSELIDANLKYKAAIKEVDKETKRLKKMMKKGK